MVKVDSEPAKYFLGATEPPWKERFSNYKNSFNSKWYKNTTMLGLQEKIWILAFPEKKKKASQQKISYEILKK